jgi:hypothetical protein
MTSVIDLVKQFPDLNLTVKAVDLIEMIDYCVGRTRTELEQVLTDSSSETYPSRQEVADILDVDLSTLHRWNKMGYLKSIRVGGKCKYRMSDVKKILESDKQQKSEVKNSYRKMGK